MSNEISNLSPTETRALKLLGDGLKQNVVADILGLSEGRISQLMADDSFAAQVSELKYNKAVKYKEMDDVYDEIERKAQDKFKQQISFISKPRDLLRAIQVINAAKRRTATVDEGVSSVSSGTVVNITIPISIASKYITDQQNKVIQVDGRDLITAPAGSIINKSTTNAAPKLEDKSSHDRITKEISRSRQEVSLSDIV